MTNRSAVPDPTARALAHDAAPAAAKPSLGTAAARGLALFLAAFTLFNLLLQYRIPNYDANVWWIRFSPPLPEAVGIVALFAVSILLLTYVFAPVSISPFRRRATRTGVELLWLVLAWDTLGFYVPLFKGIIHSRFPIAFTLFVAAALWPIWKSAGSARPVTGPAAWVVMAITFIACLVIFPLLQMICFGLTDYRRPADVAVVFGARVFDDGTPSDALHDRTQLAIDLYDQHLVGKLILSGGPNSSGVNETEAMRRMALSAGVKPEDLFTDPDGINTEKTVVHAIARLERLRTENETTVRPRVLAISHFYHLPRVKMAFAQEGWDVYTVPVREPLVRTPRYMAREVVALWKYYFDALR